MNLVATALAYFQRFFLHRTMFDMHPSKLDNVHNACLFLAQKVLEVNYSNDQFCGVL